MADVTIVGYGPVGQLLAAMLGQRGYRVVVFERWASDYFTYQPDIEDTLTARVRALPNVEVTMGYQVQQLTQSDGHVEIAAVRFEPDAELRREETAIRRQVRSRYVVG